MQVSFGSFIATVAEVEVDHHGEVRVRRVTSAVDTGIAVNPDTVVAQLQGGLIFGLTAALYGEITIERAACEQSNFNDYRMLRIDEAPAIEVHLIKSGEAPGGIGETGTTAAPPALRNAIYAATGIGCGDCRSTATFWRGGNRHERPFANERAVALHAAWHRRGRWLSCCSDFSGSSVGPGPLAFAGGHRVSLAGLSAAPIHGRPPELTPCEPCRTGAISRHARPIAKPATPRHGGTPFAGGLAFVLPFGTIYSPNITPDKDTGIGSWSDAAFLNAVHKGIRRRRRAALSGHALASLHDHDRRGRAGDQGLSLQSQACRMRTSPTTPCAFRSISAG